MSELIRSGRVLDVVLTIVLLEIVLLIVSRAGRSLTRRGPDLLAHLCAAAGLLTASHLIMVRAHWAYSGIALSAALFSHLIALRARSCVSPQRGVAPTPTFSNRLV